MTIIPKLHQIFLNAEIVSTDTRTLEKGALFFALSGTNFNANEYVQEAFDKGAYCVVMDDPKYYDEENKKMFLVKDALKTLQDLANYHRNYIGLPILALTGSNGKTTTKNLIHTVLSQKFHVLATKGNLNNHIGVPLSLLAITEAHDFGLIEMGANHPGEIESLCKIIEPDYGYITNFGKAHLEGFGSLEGVVQAKSELYRYLKNKGASVFVYANDKKQKELTEQQDRILFESAEDFTADFQLLSTQPKLKFRYKSHTVTTNLVGEYNFINCIAALHIGSYFGVTDALAIQALEAYVPDNNRSQLLKTEKNLLLLDAYNANPTSMQASIDSFLKEEVSTQKMMILGDMFELGDSATYEHQAVVDFLGNYPSIKVYLVGENFYHTSNHTENIQVYKTREALAKALKESKVKSAYILLKGSRGMALEQLVEYL